MTSWWLWIMTLLAATGVTHGVVAAQTSPPQGRSQEGVDVQALLDERTAGAIAGVTAAIISGETERSWTSGARSAGGPPVDGSTVFEIGSVSKVLTALLLAEMVARGEVALDDAISKFLPAGVGAPAGDREITLLDLATHTSGLPRLPTNLVPSDMSNPYAAYDAGALHAFLQSHTLRREPGTEYEYSNLGAGLLGYVLALRAGMTYEDLVTERILRPLGMNDTRITLDDASRARLATGHAADRTAVSNWDLNVLAGAGGWRSTADDMLRLLRAALKPPSGTLGEAFALAMTPQRDTGQPGMRIGLGWHILGDSDGGLLLHNGRTGGYYAFASVDPQHDLAVLLLANTSAPLDDLGFRLLTLAREGGVRDVQ